MRVDVARDLGRSAAAFRDIVWPEIKHWCRGGEIIPVESVTESGFARTLDQLAGIDAWQAVEDIGMRGIASRVQWVAKPYRSFTIRETRTSGAETELEKRMRALEDREGGWLLPSLTVQAYLDRDTDELLYACMIRTVDLFDHIRNTDRWERRVNHSDGNTFVVVWCDDLKASGYKVREWLPKAAYPVVMRRVFCLPATPARSIAVPRVLNGVGPRTRAERSGGRSTSPASPLAAPVSRLGGFWVAGGGVGAGWRRRDDAPATTV